MNDCLPPDLISAAMRLVGAVRDEGRDEVNAVMVGVDLRGLCVTLAAMVPDDQSAADLLAWNDRPQLPYDKPTGAGFPQLRSVPVLTGQQLAIRHAWVTRKRGA